MDTKEVMRKYLTNLIASEGVEALAIRTLGHEQKEIEIDISITHEENEKDEMLAARMIIEESFHYMLRQVRLPDDVEEESYPVFPLPGTSERTFAGIEKALTKGAGVFPSNARNHGCL